MANIQSEGLGEDFIRAITQTACAEVHAKTLYEKALGDLENGKVTDEEPHLVKMDGIIEDINELAELRRAMMLKLYEMYEGDKTVWCMIKHLAVAAYTMFEAYEASDDDPELLELAMNSQKAFNKALSKFLGVEITTCSACLGEFLKAKEKK